MSIPPYPFSQNQFMPKTEQRILWELRKTNEYLEVFIGLFLKVHPEAETQEVDEELQKIKDKKPPIGFGSKPE